MVILLFLAILTVLLLALLVISPTHRMFLGVCSLATIISSLVLVAFNLTSEQQRPNELTPEEVAYFKKQGQQIIALAFAKLNSELTQALTNGGVAAALIICSEKAQLLTSQIAQTHNVSLRRAAVRNRNPQNAADPLERSAINTFLNQIAKAELPEPIVRKNANGYTTLIAPILISSTTCLKCHGTPGETIAPADYQIIRQLYPNDNATRFQLGDLRGVWRLDFPK